MHSRVGGGQSGQCVLDQPSRLGLSSLIFFTGIHQGRDAPNEEEDTMAVTTRTRQPQHVTEPAVDTASPVDPAADAATAQRLTGVAYLRVSTKEQATRGGRAEGFSIPAQREAIHKLARDKGVTIIEEFVDAGESATSARRPELQRMLTFIKEHPVNICYVHKLDRLARNREDDVAINLVLRQYGVRLVSCTENIDQTASGELVHGIFAAISEFYSRNLSTEVTKGLRQKAINGGTINRAPLGYINIRQTDQNGREVRTVDVDPARAPLIAWAFEAYATGEWSLSDLCDELTLRGLTSLPTPKRPAKPIRINTLARMLHNPYYRGEIVYKGARHMGTHDPLVNDLVWLKVQDMLQAHNKAGDRTQVHDHYLKGSLHCECGSKMTVNLATNRHGETYPYFICLGRHTKQNGCRAHAVLVSTVERLVEEHYKTVEISPEASEALEGMIGEIFTRIDATSDQERTVLRKQAEKL
jgi:DNA invertase Pin-like site-specific DNA recombinase